MTRHRKHDPDEYRSAVASELSEIIVALAATWVLQDDHRAAAFIAWIERNEQANSVFIYDCPLHGPEHIFKDGRITRETLSAFAVHFIDLHRTGE